MIALILHFFNIFLQVTGHATSHLLFGCDLTRNYVGPLSTKHGYAICPLAVHLATLLFDPPIISTVRSVFQVCVAPTDTSGDPRGGPLVHTLGQVGLLSVAITTAMTIVHYSLYFI